MPADLDERAEPRPEVPVFPELTGVVIEVTAVVGERLTSRSAVAVMESMKMEVPILSLRSGSVRRVVVRRGDYVTPEMPIAYLLPD